MDELGNRRCINCGKLFLPKHPTDVFCSAECRREYRRKKEWKELMPKRNRKGFISVVKTKKTTRVRISSKFYLFFKEVNFINLFSKDNLLLIKPTKAGTTEEGTFHLFRNKADAKGVQFNPCGAIEFNKKRYDAKWSDKEGGYIYKKGENHSLHA
jgi:hypothetical protein